MVIAIFLGTMEILFLVCLASPLIGLVMRRRIKKERRVWRFIAHAFFYGGLIALGLFALSVAYIAIFLAPH